MSPQTHPPTLPAPQLGSVLWLMVHIPSHFHPPPLPALRLIYGSWSIFPPDLQLGSVLWFMVKMSVGTPPRLAGLLAERALVLVAKEGPSIDISVLARVSVSLGFLCAEVLWTDYPPQCTINIYIVVCECASLLPLYALKHTDCPLAWFAAVAVVCGAADAQQ